MNKLKDIFYDKNDILVALIILAVAAIVIFWRVDTIMAYPETLVAEAANKYSNDNTNTEDPSTVTTGGAVDGNVSDGTIDGNSSEVKICAVYINYGESLDVVAQNCVAAGLISSADEFISVVNTMGVGGSIQSGQHHIPSNVTPEELVQYLLQPGL
ncbi:MAG: endolytic transglycosylase MltG [Firmicutes bacterium]|nr:endolytic transglycosylase MltG [Bacillota bacterium]